MKLARAWRFAVTATWVCAASSCDAPTDSRNPPSVVRDTIGDTVVVRVIGDGDWGTGLSLVPDLVIGGSDEDPDAIFGGLGPMALLPGGGVVVVDWMGPRVLEYDAQGRLVRTFGRKGQGPGEYEDASVAAVAGGHLAVADVGNRKIIMFDSLGRVSSEWRVEATLAYGAVVSSGRGGELVLRTFTREANARTAAGFSVWHPSFLVLSADGDTLDVVSAPHHDEADFPVGFVPFQPMRIVEWHPDGFIVTGRTDTYAIEIFRPREAVVRIVRDWTPARLHDDEWDLWNQGRDFMNRRGPPVPFPEIPREKPAFARIIIARTGEIWVQRHTSAVRLAPQPKDIMAAGGQNAIPWREPLLFDVYGVDGSFLGCVSGPPGVVVGAISGDTVWGARSAAYDIPQVIRYVVAR